MEADYDELIYAMCRECCKSSSYAFNSRGNLCWECTHKEKPMARTNWSTECCTECGNEGLASRGEEEVKQGPYTCSDCDLYGRAFDAGYEARRKDEVTEAKAADKTEFDANNEECVHGCRRPSDCLDCVSGELDRMRGLHAVYVSDSTRMLMERNTKIAGLKQDHRVMTESLKRIANHPRTSSIIATAALAECQVKV